MNVLKSLSLLIRLDLKRLNKFRFTYIILSDKQKISLDLTVPIFLYL